MRDFRKSRIRPFCRYGRGQFSILVRRIFSSHQYDIIHENVRISAPLPSQQQPNTNQSWVAAYCVPGRKQCMLLTHSQACTCNCSGDGMDSRREYHQRHLSNRLVNFLLVLFEIGGRMYEQ